MKKILLIVLLSNLICKAQSNFEISYKFIDKDNQVKNFVATRTQLYEPFNRLLKHYGLPNLSA